MNSRHSFLVLRTSVTSMKIIAWIADPQYMCVRARSCFSKIYYYKKKNGIESSLDEKNGK